MDDSCWSEDVAAASAAGPAGAFLVQKGVSKLDETITIHQGRFTRRASMLLFRYQRSHASCTIALWI
jgi:predicted PhzF superfamily epimerase YddE/YHI9